MFVSEDVLLLHDFGNTLSPRCSTRYRGPGPCGGGVASPGVGSVRFQDPCWPNLPALEGGLIVSLFYQEEIDGPFLGPHLWWLLHRYRPCGDRVGGSVARSRWGDGAGRRRRASAVRGNGTDGTPLLAYLSRSAGQPAWDLWVAQLAFERRNDAHERERDRPRRFRRKLGDACVGLALTFSADGRSIHVSSRTVRDGLPSGTLRTCTYRVDGHSASG